MCKEIHLLSANITPYSQIGSQEFWTEVSLNTGIPTENPDHPTDFQTCRNVSRKYLGELVLFSPHLYPTVLQSVAIVFKVWCIFYVLQWQLGPHSFMVTLFSVLIMLYTHKEYLKLLNHVWFRLTILQIHVGANLGVWCEQWIYRQISNSLLIIKPRVSDGIWKIRSLGYDFITLKVSSSRGRLWPILFLYAIHFNMNIYVNGRHLDVDEIKKI